MQTLIVGGGISGLACAYALKKAGVQAQVMEASASPGGMIRSEKRNGYLLEAGPQSFSATPELLALCKELGIEKDLVEAPPKAPRYLLIGGKLRPAPLSPPAFFASPLFSMKTKWSVVRDLFGHSAAPVEEESVAAFVRRKFSGELLDKLAGPFVSGIYAGDPEQLSLRGAFPQLYEAEKSAGSVIRGMMRAAKSKEGPRERPKLCNFREGNDTLVRALAANLGANLRCNARVVSIQKEVTGSGSTGQRFAVEVQTQDGAETFVTDNVVMAAPTYVAGSLLKNVAPSLPEALARIEYAKMAVVSLGYKQSAVKRSMDGFGFLVPRSEGLRVLGTVWNSSLFPARAPEGHILLTSFVGGATDPDASKIASEELVAAVHQEIAPVMSIAEQPVFSSVEIHERAIPQYDLGHTARIVALERAAATRKNLKLAGNYLHGPAIGACVEQALKAASELTAL
jgi:oxygen-dependent protoporphyrinogen oxidase